MKLLGQTTMWLAFLAAAAQGSPRVEMLLPADHVSTSVPYIHLVGRASVPVVVAELNGAVVDSITVRDSVFHYRLDLPFGLNQVRIRAAATEDTTAAVDLEVLCGPRIGPAHAQVYIPHEFHGRGAQDVCLACHAREQSAAAGSEDLAWCVTCHAATGRRFKRHLADGRGGCTGCHRIADDLSRTMTGNYSDMNPCFGCHTDKIGQFAQDYIHGPVAGGSCTICHNPHGSEYEKNLRSPVPFLCMFCHTALEEIQAKVKHKPFADGRCTDCHDPHSTGNRWVLVKSSGEVCLQCHEGKLENHLHKYEVKPRQRLESNLQLNEQGLLECLTCHAPHATNSEHLLKTDADFACAGCHPGHI